MPHYASNWPRLPKPVKPRQPKWTHRLGSFAVHFFFGSLLGSAAGVGVLALAFSAPRLARTAFLCIAGGALLGGLVAGIARDRFWTDLWKEWGA